MLILYCIHNIVDFEIKKKVVVVIWAKFENSKYLKTHQIFKNKKKKKNIIYLFFRNSNSNYNAQN